eukprot:scaffold59149_cov55-Attheya_sp.AAC.1
MSDWTESFTRINFILAFAKLHNPSNDAVEELLVETYRNQEEIRARPIAMTNQQSQPVLFDKNIPKML